MLMSEIITTRSSRRTLLALGLGAVGAAGLSACGRGFGGSDSSDAIEFMFWGEGDQNEKLLDALDLFQKTDGAPTIKAQYQGFDGYYDKLATRVAGGNPPDIFQIHLPYLTEYIERDAVLALDDYVGDLGLEDLPRTSGRRRTSTASTGSPSSVPPPSRRSCRTGPSWTSSGSRHPRTTGP